MEIGGSACLLERTAVRLHRLLRRVQLRLASGNEGRFGLRILSQLFPGLPPLGQRRIKLGRAITW